MVAVGKIKRNKIRARVKRRAQNVGTADRLPLPNDEIRRKIRAAESKAIIGTKPPLPDAAVSTELIEPTQTEQPVRVSTDVTQDETGVVAVTGGDDVTVKPSTTTENTVLSGGPPVELSSRGDPLDTKSVVSIPPTEVPERTLGRIEELSREELSIQSVVLKHKPPVVEDKERIEKTVGREGDVYTVPTAGTGRWCIPHTDTFLYNPDDIYRIHMPLSAKVPADPKNKEDFVCPKCKHGVDELYQKEKQLEAEIDEDKQQRKQLKKEKEEAEIKMFDTPYERKEGAGGSHLERQPEHKKRPTKTIPWKHLDHSQFNKEKSFWANIAQSDTRILFAEDHSRKLVNRFVQRPDNSMYKEARDREEHDFLTDIYILTRDSCNKMLTLLPRAKKARKGVGYLRDALWSCDTTVATPDLINQLRCLGYLDVGGESFFENIIKYRKRYLHLAENALLTLSELRDMRLRLQWLRKVDEFQSHTNQIKAKCMMLHDAAWGMNNSECFKHFLKLSLQVGNVLNARSHLAKALAFSLFDLPLLWETKYTYNTCKSVLFFTIGLLQVDQKAPHDAVKKLPKELRHVRAAKSIDEREIRLESDRLRSELKELDEMICHKVPLDPRDKFPYRVRAFHHEAMREMKRTDLMVEKYREEALLMKQTFLSRDEFALPLQEVFSTVYDFLVEFERAVVDNKVWRRLENKRRLTRTRCYEDWDDRKSPVVLSTYREGYRDGYLGTLCGEEFTEQLNYCYNTDASSARRAESRQVSSCTLYSDCVGVNCEKWRRVNDKKENPKSLKHT